MTGAALPVAGLSVARSLASPGPVPSPLTDPERLVPGVDVAADEFEGDDWWLDLGAGDA